MPRPAWDPTYDASRNRSIEGSHRLSQGFDLHLPHGSATHGNSVEPRHHHDRLIGFQNRVPGLRSQPWRVISQERQRSPLPLNAASSFSGNRLITRSAVISIAWVPHGPELIDRHPARPPPHLIPPEWRTPEVAFNPSLLLDGIKAIGSDAVQFDFTTAVKPALLHGAGIPDTALRYLLMPVRLN